MVESLWLKPLTSLLYFKAQIDKQGELQLTVVSPEYKNIKFLFQALCRVLDPPLFTFNSSSPCTVVPNNKHNIITLKMQPWKHICGDEIWPWTLCICVRQEGAGDVLLHGEDVGQPAGRVWDESGEGSPGAAQQAQRGENVHLVYLSNRNDYNTSDVWVSEAPCIAQLHWYQI